MSLRFRMAPAVGLLVWLMIDIGAAHAQNAYRLEPGDAVEINIASIPDGARRAVVQLDGSISVPGSGRIVVAGLTLAELQARMEAVLPSKMFHFRSADGREQVTVVTPADVSTSIVDYRPVYVTGDVLTPGQQAYRPLMTVRQVIAMAGGYSLLRARMAPTAIDPTQIQSDYESLWTDYVKSYFHAARVRAELQEQSSFDQRAPAGSPLPAQFMTSVAKNEMKALLTSLQEERQYRTYMNKTVKDEGDQITVLLKQQQEETLGVKADENEVAALTRLYNSGALTNARMSDSRRALLMSSDRALQTTVELMGLRRQQADAARQIEREANQRHLTLLTDLQETGVRLEDLGVKLRAVGQRLQPVGGTAPVASMAGEPAHPHAVIVRKTGDEWRKIAADPDVEVMPGDVIEASFGDELQQTALH